VTTSRLTIAPLRIKTTEVCSRISEEIRVEKAAVTSEFGAIHGRG
jgi:hypothetical protein